jgi:hypothetical protein
MGTSRNTELRYLEPTEPEKTLLQVASALQIAFVVGFLSEELF